MTAERQRRGREAEEYVAGRLAAAGFQILARNARPGGGVRGELDIIARDGRSLVFVEVKARSTAAVRGPTSPALAVTPRKQAQLRRLAGAWLRAGGPSGGFASLRFDVAGVWIEAGRGVVGWEYLRAAF